MLLFTCLLILITWAQILLGLLTVSNILKLSIPIYKTLFGGLIFSIINAIPIYMTGLSVSTIFLLTTISLLLICVFLFDLGLKKSLFFVMSNLLFSAIIECVMIIFDTLILSQQGFFYSNVRDNTLLLSLRTISLIPCFLLYFLSGKLLPNPSDPTIISKKTINVIILNTIILALFVCPNMIYFEHFEIMLNESILVYNIALILVFVGYNFFNSYRAYQMGKQAVLIENQKVYTETLENALEQIKGFRHEMNNMISTIAGFVELERLDLLRPYIGDLQQRLTAQSSTNVLNLNLREVPILYGLLIGKVNYATNMGVRFEIAIVTKEEIVFPNEVLYDLAYIMGVWLDNAIEAAAASELKQVNLLVRDDRDCYNIVVRNSFEGEVDLEKIKRKNYSTKSNHMGIGLHQVEEKVQAQSKYFSSSTTINECFFIQHLQVKK